MLWGREDKLPKLQEAMDWVKDNYRITEWERDIFGSYQIKGTIEKINALAKTKLEGSPS